MAGAEEEEYEEDPYAMYVLGTYYAKGKSVEKDLILARSFFARSGVLVEKAQVRRGGFATSTSTPPRVHHKHPTPGLPLTHTPSLPPLQIGTPNALALTLP